MPETSICPECGQPVGVDPHEECFKKAMARQEQGVGAFDVMPCPACGEDMATPNAECEDHPS